MTGFYKGATALAIVETLRSLAGLWRLTIWLIFG